MLVGLRRVYRPIGRVVNFSSQGERRCVNAPRGVFGGGPGATGRFAPFSGRSKGPASGYFPRSAAMGSSRAACQAG